MMKGHFPHGLRCKMTLDQVEEYNRKVAQLLLERRFPKVGDLPGGHVIMSC